MPQIGPGKGDGATGHGDFGREQVTGKPRDRYRFRTPTLRNVAVTAPYGHLGQAGDLRDHIQIYAIPERFPEAADTLVASYPDAVERMPLRANSYAVIVTRGHKEDGVVLEENFQSAEAPAGWTPATVSESPNGKTRFLGPFGPGRV